MSKAQRVLDALRGKPALLLEVMELLVTEGPLNVAGPWRPGKDETQPWVRSSLSGVVADVIYIESKGIKAGKYHWSLNDGGPPSGGMVSNELDAMNRADMALRARGWTLVGSFDEDRPGHPQNDVASRSPEEARVIEGLRERLAGQVGFTLRGDYLTMRFNQDGKLVQVMTAIVRVDHD